MKSFPAPRRLSKRDDVCRQIAGSSGGTRDDSFRRAVVIALWLIQKLFVAEFFGMLVESPAVGRGALKRFAETARI